MSCQDDIRITYIPVSYTHLDVYKRQEIAKANIKADISEGFTLIEVNEKDKDKRLKSDILTKSFMLSVKGIEEENPEFIKLNITEE